MSTTTQIPTQRPAGEPLGPLAARLLTADRILQKERGGTALLRRWQWIAGFLFVCFITDVAVHLAAGPRVALGAAFVLLALCGAGWCAWIAWGRRNSFEHVARVLESRHPRLGETGTISRWGLHM